MEPRWTIFKQLQPLSQWSPGYLESRQVTPLDSHSANWVSALLLPCLVPWFLASCWQCWALGTDFGKIIGAKYDVICSYGTCVLACTCCLSPGTVDSWPELGDLLLTNTTCLSDSSWMLSTPVGDKVWWNERAGLVPDRLSSNASPGTSYLCDLG